MSVREVNHHDQILPWFLFSLNLLLRQPRLYWNKWFAYIHTINFCTLIKINKNWFTYRRSYIFDNIYIHVFGLLIPTPYNVLCPNLHDMAKYSRCVSKHKRWFLLWWKTSIVHLYKKENFFYPHIWAQTCLCTCAIPIASNTIGFRTKPPPYK